MITDFGYILRIYDTWWPWGGYHLPAAHG